MARQENDQETNTAHYYTPECEKKKKKKKNSLGCECGEEKGRGMEEQNLTL